MPASSRFLILLFSFTLFTVACKKKEIPGPKGEPGTNGTGGNASLSERQLFLVAATQWTATTDSTSWFYTLETASVTAKIADEGLAKIYVQKNNLWYEVPFADGDLVLQAGFSAGKVQLNWADIHGELPARPASSTFRLSILTAAARNQPGGVQQSAIVNQVFFQ